MKLFKNLKLWARPPKLEDPVFGTLTYMHVSNAPERSYWEAEWVFPPTGNKVSIAIPGGVDGPSPAAREFYLGLPARFDEIVARARPLLDQIFREWMDRGIHQDLWKDVVLGGFNLEDPGAKAVAWAVTFETTGDKWLGIAIPFVGDSPQTPEVST